jgi:hypothetical protein
MGRWLLFSDLIGAMKFRRSAHVPRCPDLASPYTYPPLNGLVISSKYGTILLLSKEFFFLKGKKKKILGKEFFNVYTTLPFVSETYHSTFYVRKDD